MNKNHSKNMNALVKAKQQSNANKDYLLKMELKEYSGYIKFSTNNFLRFIFFLGVDFFFLKIRAGFLNNSLNRNITTHQSFIWNCFTIFKKFDI